MKPLMLLVLSVGVFTCSINQLYSQTKYNYSGNFNTETMNGVAKYQYYENSEGERIYDGKFSFEVKNPLLSPILNMDILKVILKIMQKVEDGHTPEKNLMGRIILLSVIIAHMKMENLMGPFIMASKAKMGLRQYVMLRSKVAT